MLFYIQAFWFFIQFYFFIDLLVTRNVLKRKKWASNYEKPKEHWYAKIRNVKLQIFVTTRNKFVSRQTFFFFFTAEQNRYANARSPLPWLLCLLKIRVYRKSQLELLILLNKKKKSISTYLIFIFILVLAVLVRPVHPKWNPNLPDRNDWKTKNQVLQTYRVNQRRNALLKTGSSRSGQGV